MNMNMNMIPVMNPTEYIKQCEYLWSCSD